MRVSRLQKKTVGLKNCLCVTDGRRPVRTSRALEDKALFLCNYALILPILKQSSRRKSQSHLKVAREPLHLPVAIARWVEAAATIEFGRKARLGVGAPHLRFGERPSPRRLEIACGRLIGLGAD